MMLVATNLRVHANLDELLLQTMELLTALDLATAGARWQEFRVALQRHMETEEAVAFPRYAALPHHERGGSPEILAGDHNVILRNCTECETRLDAFPSDATLRREVVLALDVFHRLRHVLDHHTQREQTLMYPALERALGADDITRIVEALTASP